MPSTTANHINKGDYIILFSSRARAGKRVRVREAHHFPDHTTLELVGQPPIKLTPDTRVELAPRLPS